MMRYTMAMVAALVLLGCGQAEQSEPGKSALSQYADQLEKSGLAERLEKMDERLAGIEETLGILQKKVEQGVRVAVPTQAIAAPDAADKAGTRGAEQAAPEAPEPAAVEGFELTLEAPAKPVSLVLWHAYRGQEKEAFEKTCRDFTEEYPTIVVEPQEVPFMALRDKIVVTVPRGTGPDLFVYVHNPIGDWLHKGNILVPLSSYIEKFDSFDNLQRFIPDTVKALAYDGTLYGLPLAFKARAMFYNKKIIKQVPTNVAELVRVARTATSGEGEDRVYGLLYEAGLLYHHAPWAHGFGAQVLDEAGVPHINSPEFVQSVAMVRSWVKDEQVLPDLNKDMAKFLFNNGQAGIVFKGPWFLGEIDEGIEYGVAPMPEVAAGRPAKPYLGADGIYLADCSKNKELAFQVMRYLVSDEAAAHRYVAGGQLVANAGLYENEELSAKANPALEVFRAQADHAVIISARPEMQAVWSTVDNALRKVIFGEADAQAALDEAQAKVEKDIAAMGNQ